jgi:hypothetical protein
VAPLIVAEPILKFAYKFNAVWFAGVAEGSVNFRPVEFAADDPVSVPVIAIGVKGETRKGQH